MTQTPDDACAKDERPKQSSDARDGLPCSEAGTQAPPETSEFEDALGAELEAWLRHFGEC